MRVLPVAAAALLVLATPTIALAQDAPAPDSEALSELSHKLADPAFQDQAALMGQVLMQTLLEMPVGPMAEAMNKATGGKGPAIDPDAKVKDLAPNAEELPEQVVDKLPMAMNAMSGMAEGMQAMLPALREMAASMRGAFPNRGEEK